ncbi:MAG: hypothetical protein FJX71_04095 [Alphaproteobacteria bacterium]|nr:hypothetical protein [Alphaproteobacteria bacterium]
MKLKIIFFQSFLYIFLITAAMGAESARTQPYIPFPNEATLFVPHLLHVQPTQFEEDRSFRDDIASNMKGVEWKKLKEQYQRKVNTIAQVCRFSSHPVVPVTLMNLTSGPLPVLNNYLAPWKVATYGVCYEWYRTEAEFHLYATNNASYIQVSYDTSVHGQESYVLRSSARLQFSEQAHNIIILKEYTPEHAQQAKYGVLNRFDADKRRRMVYGIPDRGALSNHRLEEEIELKRFALDRPAIFFYVAWRLPTYN